VNVVPKKKWKAKPFVTEIPSRKPDSVDRSALAEEDAHHETVIMDMLRDQPRPPSGLIDPSVAEIYEWKSGIGYVNARKR
jgi:hypothetical protein